MVRSRRAVLATLAAGGTLLAGCLTESEGDPADDGERRAGESSSENPEATGDREGPVARLPDERFPEGCPAYDNVDRVVCYDAVDAAEMPAVLEPSTRTVTEGDPFEFSLHNRSETALGTNFYNWLVHKRVGERWVRIPRGWVEPLYYVPAGDRLTWRFTLDNGAVRRGESVPRSLGTPVENEGGFDDTDDWLVTVNRLEGLGGGQYAFRGRGFFSGASEEDIAFATTFEIDAEPLELTVSDSIARTERDGETLRAYTEPVGAEESGTQLDVELERRAESPDGAESVIAEGLIRRPAQRDAVALAETHDADRVRIESYKTPVSLPEREGVVFEYRGTGYELSAQRRE